MNHVRSVAASNPKFIEYGEWVDGFSGAICRLVCAVTEGDRMHKGKRARGKSRGDDSAALRRRGLLIETVASSVTDILAAASVLMVLPDVLSTIAKVVRVDRVITVEIVAPDSLHTVFFKWESAVVATLPQLGPQLTQRQSDPLIQEWLMPLTRGTPVVTVSHTASEPVRQFLDQTSVVTCLLVPIMVEGRYWGHIRFDDCLSEHGWAPDDIKILTMLAQVIGAAATRERFLGQAHRHQKLLQAVNDSSATIVSAADLHQAITRVLGMVAAAVSVDRIVVMESTTADSTGSGVLLRNFWHSPQVALAVDDTALRREAGTDPDIAQWLAPLASGTAVQAQYSSASSAVRAQLARRQSASALVVPIMVDGRSWGHIGLDDCQRERVWDQAEVEVLKTLADLIGAAITRDRQLEALAKANKIIQNSPTILYRLRGEPELPMIYISPNIASLGYDAAEFMNAPKFYQQIIAPDDLSAVHAEMAALLEDHASASPMQFRILSKDGAIRWVENHYSPVRDPEGRLVEIEGILTDITERKVAEEKISLLARADALTGLANRLTFSERLRQSFSAVQRGAHSFAVLYLDLDRFKEVNDTLGHQAGDRLLQQVAARLQRATRQIDVVARLGGDEFAIVQSQLTDPSAAGALAQKLVDIISAPYRLNESDLQIGVSIGIAFATPDASGPDALLAQADQALYRAKHAGRGQYRFYSNEIDHEAREHLTLADELRLALMRDELEIRYQPQIELSSGKIVGMEALMRWNHPTRGLLLPEDFLPIAEQFSIMPQLGRWALDTACRQMSLWRRAQLPLPVLAINVALTQIKMGREFVRDVTECINRWGISPSDIELDVTELVLARATLAQSDALDELRRLGVGIAIDEFGARYSSLDYLRNYRVSRLKIARGMIAAADAEPGGSTMVRAILGLANELGIGVVAEGVETEAQRKLLVQANPCAQGQGFYYSHAVTADESVKMLQQGFVRPENRSVEDQHA